MKRPVLLTLATILAGLAPLSGCSDFADFIGLNVVVIEVYNDTDYDVAPEIRYDDSTSWLAGIFPSERLTPQVLEPGDFFRYEMDCDELGVIFSDGAEQYDFAFTIAEVDRTKTLERDDDFDCGDTIQFHFIGHDDSFGVLVSINGRVVDSE